MSEKKKFLLRLDSGAYAALEKWAADDLRSINAQIEFILTESMRNNGRFKSRAEINASRSDPEAKNNET